MATQQESNLHLCLIVFPARYGKEHRGELHGLVSARRYRVRPITDSAHSQPREPSEPERRGVQPTATGRKR